MSTEPAIPQVKEIVSKASLAWRFPEITRFSLEPPILEYDATEALLGVLGSPKGEQQVFTISAEDLHKTHCIRTGFRAAPALRKLLTT